MILENDTRGIYFKLSSLTISDVLSKKIIEASSNFEESFTKYGKPKRWLYMLNRAVDTIPELSEVYNYFYDSSIIKTIDLIAVSPRSLVLTHSDPNRYAAINIPVFGNFENSYVTFFENIENQITTIDNREDIIGVKRNFDKPGKVITNAPIIGKVYYNNPVCLNVDMFHNVTNPEKTSRVVLSIGFGDLKFEEVEMLHLENKLIV
jgi:hypothetical protein